MTANTFRVPSYIRLLGRHLKLNLGYTFFFVLVYFLVWHKGEPSWTSGQVEWTRLYMLVVFLHLFLAVVHHWQGLLAGLKEWLEEKASPWNLAIFRVLFLSAVVWDMQGWAYGYGVKWTSLPKSQMVPLPIIGWLGYLLPISPGLYTTATKIATVCLVLAILGLWTRKALLLYIPFGFYIWAVPCFYGKLNHNQIMLWFPFLLALSPCADVFSLDSLWKRWRTGDWSQPAHKAAYGLPLRFVLLLLAVIYFWAGVFKFWDSGFDWALSNSMVGQFQLEWIEHFDELPMFRIDHWPLVAKLGGVAVIYFEMLFVFLLFHPWTRFIAFFFGLGFHHGTAIFLYIDFMMIRRTYIALVPWFAIFYWMTCKLGLTSGTPPQEGEKREPLEAVLKQPWMKSLWVSGWILVSVNFVCGMFTIHSFPFSAYPNYSSLVPSRYREILFEVKDLNGRTMNVKLLAMRARFRQENILPLQSGIFDALSNKKKKLAAQRTKAYFKIWQTHVKSLAAAALVKAYYVETGLAPEKRRIIYKRYKVAEFELTVDKKLLERIEKEHLELLKKEKALEKKE